MAIGDGRDSGRHRKKEPSRLFLGHEGRFAQIMGICQMRIEGFCGVFFGIQKVGRRGTRC